MGPTEHSTKLSDIKPAQPPNEFGREVLEFVERVEALSLFQDRITKPARIPQVWAAFQEEAARLVTSKASALYLVDPQSHAFELNQWTPEDCGADCRREIEAQIECGTFAWIVNRRQPAIIPSLVFRGAQNLVMLPLTTHSRTLGVAMIVAAIEEQAVTHERLRLLGILSKQCALVMENTLLYDHLKTEHEALQAAQAQIIQAEKFASIGRLTSGAFHELLNPLNVISGHLQLMMMADEVKAPFRDYLPAMKSAADRIAFIVNSLLRFSAKRSKRRQTIAIADLLHEVVQERMGPRSEGSITVRLALGNDLPPLSVNAKDLKTVLANLVDNACDAMPQGGLLTLGARVCDGAPTETGRPPLVEITVADNGRGIEASDIHKVFDPFFSTKEIGEGTGLSLAVSYALVCAMGGTLAFESSPTEGTVFSVRLPLEGDPDSSNG